MGDGHVLTKTEVAGRYRGCKSLGEALMALIDRGWTVKAQGHGVRVYCPCGGAHGASVPGSPGNEGQAAKRVRRMADKCPG